MYSTLIELMFAVKIIVICLCPCLINITWWCHMSGGTHFYPWYSLHYGLQVIALLLYDLFV